MTALLTNRTEPIPGYRLIERLGRGGFGEVWKCEAPGGFLKAIKLVYGNLDVAGEDGKAAEQEKKSLERIKQIRHPFLLSLERYDVIDGQLMIVMELADRSLWDRFRDCRTDNLPGIPREELLRYLTEAAEALDMMNQEHNLQHLDVKPQNLFLVHNHVKVADFGLVKVFEGMSASVTGGVTPVYAAPETFDDRVTRFSDQYSLAIVYQELLTGRRPFNGANTRQLILQHLTQPPDLSPLPECDRASVGRSLAKKPDQRFPSCSEFIASLRVQVSGGPNPPSPALAEQRNGSPTTTPAPTNALPTSAVNGTGGPPAPAPPLVRVPLPSQLIGRQPARDPTSTQSLGPAVATMPRPANVSVSVPLSVGPVSPTEQTGPGALLPAVVIGIGQVGGRVVRHLRRAVHEQFGSSEAVPQVRFLTVDTDADAVSQYGRDVLVTKLHRPSHYLAKAKDGGGLDWLPPGLLYRLPRNPVTNAHRGLGRLAFFDYAREIEQRLKAELDAALVPDALIEADRRTKLGIRTNRPRVYIVATPAGGTGGGMALDMAYLARHLQRKLGYAKPEVIGVLMLPPTDKNTPKLALANTYAALAELAHFSRPDTTYEARFNPREAAVHDADRPFARCLCLPLPASNDAAGRRQATGLAAGLMFREFLAPLGRVTDAARPAAPAAEFCYTAGSFRLAWPGGRLAHRAARHLAVHLLEQWTTKDLGPIQADVTAWIEEQWDARQLRPELLIDRLCAAGDLAAGMAPEARFEAIVAQLLKKSTPNAPIDARTACAVLAELTDLVGKPIFGDEPPPGQLQKSLESAARGLTTEYEQKLAELAVHFIELPRHRLAAAEEAVRQLTARLKQAVETYDAFAKSLTQEATSIYARVMKLIGVSEAGAKKTTIGAEAIDLLSAFPKKRYQAVVAGLVLSMYRGMVSAAPEYLREVNLCRKRIGEAAALLDPTASDANAGPTFGPGRDLFPAGRRGVDEAAADLVSQISADDLIDLDNRVQTQVRAQFRALVSVCLESNGPPTPLAELVNREAEEFLAKRVGRMSAAEAVFDAFAADPQAAHRAAAEAYDEAEPTLMVKAGTRLDLLAVPAGIGGAEFLRLVADAVPGAELLPAESPDEVVFYRERSGLMVSDLPQFGPAAKAAYDSLKDGEHAPHARGDVAWKPPMGR
jgi:serine/threonine protein kinase